MIFETKAHVGRRLHVENLSKLQENHKILISITKLYAVSSKHGGKKGIFHVTIVQKKIHPSIIISQLPLTWI